MFLCSLVQLQMAFGTAAHSEQQLLRAHAKRRLDHSLHGKA
jgi:hypothetical protein